MITEAASFGPRSDRQVKKCFWHPVRRTTIMALLLQRKWKFHITWITVRPEQIQNPTPSLLQASAAEV